MNMLTQLTKVSYELDTVLDVSMYFQASFNSSQKFPLMEILLLFYSY